MARPLRPQWKDRIRVRRRHRTWMTAMILATAGWGVWWSSLFSLRFFPNLYPGTQFTYSITCTVAAVGLFLAVFTVRARLIWVLLAGVPICSNGSLLLMPLLLNAEQLESLTTPRSQTQPGPTPGNGDRPRES